MLNHRHAKNLNLKPDPQRGSVIIFLLVGVVLFGAIMMHFSRSHDSAASQKLTQSEARAVAITIVNYNNALRQTVDKLRSNGCGLHEISIDPPPYTGPNINPNSPPDRRCHVFAPEGGKLRQPRLVSAKVYDLNTLPAAWPGYSLNHNNMVMHIARQGSSGPTASHDISLVMGNIRTEVCQEINKIVGVPTPAGNPPRDDLTQVGGGGFIGTIPPAPSGRNRQLRGANNEFVGRPMGCYVSNNFNLVGCPGCDRNYFIGVISTL